MPLLAPTDIRPARLIGFNYAKSWNEPKTGVGIHFFLDDYQFERIWNKPEEYTRLLASFDMACAPDWSLYLDMPRPMQQWNVYRSRAIGDWWQRQGLAVVPTLSWSDENSYEYCFNGLPTGSTVARTPLARRHGRGHRPREAEARAALRRHPRTRHARHRNHRIRQRRHRPHGRRQTAVNPGASLLEN